MDPNGKGAVVAGGADVGPPNKTDPEVGALPNVKPPKADLLLFDCWMSLVGLSSILNSWSLFFGGVAGRSTCRGFETSPAVLPPAPNVNIGGGTGLAEGVPKVKGVTFSAAWGVLGAPKVKGAGLPGFVSLSGAPKAKGAGLADFVSFESCAPKENGAGLADLVSPFVVAPKLNGPFDTTGFGASIAGSDLEGWPKE